MKRGYINLVIVIVLVVGLLNVVNAEIVCETYDDFSSGSLEEEKWEEIGGSDVNSLFVDEHLVEDETYHTANLNQADKGVTLKLKGHTFLPGEVVEYDIEYIGGSGNRISIVDLDDNYRWLGQIGTWNDAGDNFGTFHFKVEFDNQGADVIITKPDETTITKRLDSLGETHTFGFGTRTGHNGLVHMDYDNVIICSDEPEPSLEERIAALEERVTLLELLNQRLKNYFVFMPFSIKKNIVCGELENSEESEVTDLGITCEMKQKKKKQVCSCNKERDLEDEGNLFSFSWFRKDK